MTTITQNDNTPEFNGDDTVESLDAIKQSLAFFTDKTDVETTEVKEEDKPIVDGLEDILRSLSGSVISEENRLKEIEIINSYTGAENWQNKTRAAFSTLIQLAKDVFNFVISLIYNKVSRLDNRTMKASDYIKRNGLKQTPIAIPEHIGSRLATRESSSNNPNWIQIAIDQSTSFYESMMAINKLLVTYIATGAGFDETRAVKEVTEGMAKILSSSSIKDNKASMDLPGGKRAVVEIISDGRMDGIPLYVEKGNVYAYPSKPILITKHATDGVISSCESAVRTIRKYQSAPQDLVRAFEREAASYQRRTGYSMSARQETFLRWLIRLNKRVCTISIKQIFDSANNGLDVCFLGGNE